MPDRMANSPPINPTKKAPGYNGCTNKKIRLNIISVKKNFPTSPKKAALSSVFLSLPYKLNLKARNELGTTALIPPNNAEYPETFPLKTQKMIVTKKVKISCAIRTIETKRSE